MFRIATDTSREFGQIIAVVKAAELLDLVDTPKRLVVLTGPGRDFAAARAEERKRIWRERLLTLCIFRTIHALVARQPTGAVARDIVEEMLVLGMPYEDHERQFETLLAWARFCDLLAYDEVAQQVTLGAMPLTGVGTARH